MSNVNDETRPLTDEYDDFDFRPPKKRKRKNKNRFRSYLASSFFFLERTKDQKCTIFFFFVYF